MHDVFGRPLNPGDIVVVPFIVKRTIAATEYCNCDLVAVGEMPPQMTKTTLSATNTRQTIRANPGDDARFGVVHDGEHTKIVPQVTADDAEPA